MPALQKHQYACLPQAFLTNLHNRLKNDDNIIMVVTSQPTRQHKRAKIINYAEFDNDIFDDFAQNDYDDEMMDFNNVLDDNDNNNLNDNLNNKILSNAQIDNGLTDNKDFRHGHNFPNNNNNDIDSKDINNNLSTTTTMGNNMNNMNNNNNNNHLSNTTNSNENIRNKLNLKNKLPDLDDQDDILNILKYPKIRETFQQGRIIKPIKLNLFNHNKFVMAPENEPVIIPISLNLEYSGHVINDYFTWNCNDKTITPEQFTQIYCQDLDFPVNSNLFQQIVTIINDTIQENEPIASIKIENDLQIIINLTCNLQKNFFEDKFQWNLNDSSLAPENYAEIIVTDLGLTREYIPLLSFSLHETILKIKKDFLEGHLNQEMVYNEAAFGYMAGVRLNIEELGQNWCPKIEILTLEEIQRREIEKERNLRRLKRESDRLSRRGRRRLDELETTMRI